MGQVHGYLDFTDALRDDVGCSGCAHARNHNATWRTRLHVCTAGPAAQMRGPLQQP